MVARNAFMDGKMMGAEWLGPNGEGHFGSLSLEFIRQVAEDSYPDYEEDFLEGFFAGLNGRK